MGRYEGRKNCHQFHRTLFYQQVYEQEKLHTGKIQTHETDTEVPALFLYHIAQRKAAEDALRCLRVAADLMVISVSLATIESGVSGLPLYAAYADIGVPLSDFYIETRLRDELKFTTKGKKLLELWDDIYMVQGTTGAMASMLPKAEKALDVTVEVLYTSRYPRQQESLQKLIKNALYSFPLRNYSKNGLKVLSKDGIKSITTHAADFEKLKVLFVENAKKEVAVLYKGKKFFQADSAGRTGKFLDYLYRKAGGNIAKLDQEISRLAGMAENIDTGIQMTVKEFEDGFDALIEANITPETAIDYLEDALIYFNYHVINGKIVQISNKNCVNVVQVMEFFFNTGKIITATASDIQDYKILEGIYNKPFLTIITLKTLENINYMKEGERGILFCKKGGWDPNHVLNIYVKDGKLIYKDGQIYSQLGSNRIFLENNFKSFKFLKTKSIIKK